MDCGQCICNIPVPVTKQSLFWGGYIRSSYSYAIKFSHLPIILISILSSLSNFHIDLVPFIGLELHGKEWTTGIPPALVTVFLYESIHQHCLFTKHGFWLMKLWLRKRDSLTLCQKQSGFQDSYTKLCTVAYWLACSWVNA